jgi:glycerate 2-kinase
MTLASDALAIARAGIRAVDPATAVDRALARTSSGLRIGRTRLAVRSGSRVHLVAVGKAAAAMADAAHRLLGRDVRGIVATPLGYPAPRSGLPVHFGRHPVPGTASFRAGAAVLNYARATAEPDVVVFLLSGGGSATVELPRAPLRGDDLVRTTIALLASGAPIGPMNAIRRHLSALKGGRLATATSARRFGTIAISDVVGDPPEDVASGPTVPDPTHYADALAAVRRYRLAPRLPPRVGRFLEDGRSGRHPETPKPGDPRLDGAPFVFGATNALALRGASDEARRRGYATVVLSGHVTGETRPVAERFARALVRAGAVARRRSARLSGGETTVTLGPRPGRGGRNQEFAVAAAPILAGHPRSLILSIGTDGIDGPTDAAGGWVDDASAARAGRRGVDLRAALAHHAAYDALRRLGSLVRTGPTGTNVMDVHVGLVARPGAVSPGTGGSSPRSGAPSSRRRRT